jgi:DNA-binding beta-propeller fold protein YncE
VTVISGQTNKALATMPLDPVPDETAFSSLTGDAYISGEPAAAISVLDGRTNQITASIAFPTCPTGPGVGQFAISPQTGDMYVPLTTGNPCDHNGVWVVSTKTNRTIATVGLPTEGGLIAVSPMTGEVYVLRPQVSQNGAGAYVASVISG